MMTSLLYRVVDWVEYYKLDRLAFVLVCFVLCSYNWQQTLFLSPDSHTYIRWAELLVSHDFNFSAYLRDNNFFTPPIFYLLPVTIIAGLKSISTDNWQTLFQAINTAALATCLWVYYRIAIQVRLRRWLVATSLVILMSCVDFLVWPHYLLSDMLFAMLVMILIGLHTTQTSEKYPRPSILVLTLLVLLARPSSVPFVGAVILFWIVRSRAIDSKKLAILVLGTIIAATVLFVALVSYGIEHPGNSQVEFITKLASEGIVVHDRPDTWLAPPDSVGSIATLYVIRTAYFFMPFHNDFSFLHNLMNAVSLGYILVGVFLGAIVGIKKNPTIQPALLLLSLVCLFTTLFQAATIIDYDWRYRFPVILPMTIIATIGFQSAFNILKRIDPTQS